VATPPAVVERPRVKLEVRAAPSTAQIMLDGQPLANPFAGALPLDEGQHELAVRAPGYRGETRTITLDRDRAIEIRLARDLKRPAKEEPHAEVATPPPAQPPPPSPPPGKTIYKGTKGSLITEFPEK
jgi:hypothetical protein